MPADSLRQRLNGLGSDPSSREQLVLVFTKLLDGIQAIAAKLDADAGVTDTDYAATLAAYVID